MADFTATIKVQFELLGLTETKSQTETRGTDPGKSKAAGEDKGLPTTIEGLREEFRNLSTTVRAVAQSLKQLQALGVDADPKKPVEGEPRSKGTVASALPVSGVEELTAAVKELDAVSGAAADKVRAAADKSDSASDQAEKSTADAAAQAEAYADIMERVARDMKDNAEGAKQFAGSLSDLQRVNRRTKGLEALNPERIENELNPGGLIKEVFQNVGRDPELRRAAASLNTVVKDSIRIDPKATSDVRTELERVQEKINLEISKFLKKVSAGSLEPRDAAATSGNIRTIVRDFNDTRQGGQQRIKGGAVTDIARAIGATQLVAGSDRIDAGLEKLGAAIESGADDLSVGELKLALERLAVDLTRFTSSRFSQIFGNEQDPKFLGARQSVRENLRFQPAAVQLTQPGQVNALNQLRTAVRGSGSVFDATKRVFEELTKGGTSLNQFEKKLRDFVEFLSGPGAAGIGRGREEIAKFNDIFKLLSGTKVTPQGTIRAPSGAVGAQVSQAFAGDALGQARQRLFEPGRGVGSRERVEFQTQDASGNIRKVVADLTRLGNKLDQVKVKGRDASDNMFDRTSVRAALQRVATWGAAAGIVFGAVDAFKRAVSTVVDTEAAIIGLAKVMDESTANFEGFKRTASEAAVAIAQEFGQPLEDVLETLVLFGQQGLNLSESIERAGAAALAANVTTLNQPEAASALTAALAQFQTEGLKATDVIDKFNEVSNNAAVTETVLAQAVAKAGQAANTAGVSLDQFNGIVAAISEQTRQSGNEIGTALRFIFSRLQTPEAESGLARLGVSVRDAAGETRGFVPIIEELASKFDTLSNAQKTQVAISIAGTRRFNTLLALLDNFGRFQESAANSANSAGSALSEQSKVVETAAFRIQQLKTSLAALAVSLGDSFLGPLKLVTDALSGVVDLIATLPSELTTAVAGIGLGAAGLARFGDRFVGSLGLVGAFKGLGLSIGRSLTQGLSEVDLDDALGAQSAVVRKFNPGLFASRLAGDFSFSLKNAAKDASGFTNALTKANRVLVDSNGKVVQNAASFTKFGAVVRGFKTAEQSAELTKIGVASDAAVIGIGGLNSGFSKLFAVAGRGLVRLTNAIPLLGLGFAAADRGAASLNSTLATGAVTLTRFLAAGAAIFGLVRLFGALGDSVRSGTDQAKDFEAEIATQQEGLKSIKDQIRLTGDLEKRRKKLAATGREGFVNLAPDAEGRRTPQQARDVAQIARRDFRSPLLAEQDVREQEFNVAQQVGAIRPELIDSFDKLGNVILTSADSLDAFANSAASAQSNLLALSQVKAIQALSSDFQEARTGLGGFLNDLNQFGQENFVIGPVLRFGGVTKESTQTAKETLKEVQKEVESFSKDSRNALARAFDVPVATFDPEFAEKQAKAQSEQIERLSKQRLALKAISDQVRSLPTESADLGFNAILGPTSPFQAVLTDAATDFSTKLGKEISAGDVARRLRLQVSSAFSGDGVNLRGAIGFDAKETAARFRKAGVLEQVVDLKGDLQAELDKFQEGDLVLFPDVVGFPDQAFVEISATGERILKTIDDSRREITTPLREVFSKLAEESLSAFRIDPKKLTAQINQALREVSRVTAGAGRGGLLQRDLDLGTDFKFNLSAQQRVAFDDESLVAAIGTAEEALKRESENIGATLKKLRENASESISADLPKRFNELAQAADKLKVIFRVKTIFEEVSKAFEKAADDIERANLKTRLEAEFSELRGARAGTIQRRFDSPLDEAELSAEQLFDKLNSGFVEATNTIVDQRKALRDQVVGTSQAFRDADTFVRDFERATQVGGIRDPKRLTPLAIESAQRIRGGADRAIEEQKFLAERSLIEQEEGTRLLRIIADNTISNSSQLGTLFSQAAEELTTDPDARPGQVSELVRRLSNLAPTTFDQFNRSDLEKIVGVIGTKAVPELTRAFRDSRVRSLATTANTSLVASTIGKTSEGDTVAKEVGTEVAKALEKPQRAILTRIAARARGREGGTSVDDVKELASQTATRFIATGQEDFIKAGKAILNAVDQDSDATGEVLSRFRKQIDSVNQVITPKKVERDEKKTERNVRDTLKRGKDQRAAVLKTIRNNKSLSDALLKTSGSIEKLGTTVTGARQELVKGFKTLISDLAVTARTREFTGNQIGTLAGTIVPSVDTGLFRSDLQDLSARELTAFESPGLSRSLEDSNRILQGVVPMFTRVSQLEQDLIARRAEAQRSGDADKVSLINRALQDLGNVSSLVEGQARGARDSLQRFGDAFRNIEVVNQLRQDVTKLFESFRNQQALLFDRTSIETALGRGPFASARPSFEQFEQGQAGDLTKFERALENISFRRSRGQISSQEESRETKRAEFERDEGIIQFAQQRETRRLEAQVQTAEQVRSRLQEFALSGAPGSDVAAELVRSLGSELESAGDVISSNLGAQTIRDPRTGRDVTVPGSDVRQFRGVPGLENAVRQVQQLAKAVADEENRKQAELNTRPVVDKLTEQTQVLAAKLDEIATLTKEGENLGSGAQNQKAFLSAIESLPRLFSAIENISKGTPAGDRQAQTTLTEVVGSLEKIPPELRGVIDALKVTTPDGKETTFGKLVEGVRDTSAINKQILDAGAAGGSPNERLKELDAPSDEFTKPKDAALSLTEAFLKVAGVFGDALVPLTRFFKLFGINFTGDNSSGKKFASGGLIQGPGGPRDDRVPIRASAGEFVINARAVKNLGIGNLNKLNDSNGVIGPDSSIGLTPSTRLQAGGSILKKIIKLKEEREKLFSSGVPTSEEQTRIQAIDEELKELNKTRDERRAKLAAFKKKGVRLGEVGETTRAGVVIPESVLAESNAEVNALKEKELLRRDKRSRRPGTFSGGFPPGKVFARVSEDGKRMSFSDTSDGGGIDASTLRGVPAGNPKAFRREIARRQKFQERLTAAKERGKQKVQGVEKEFIELLAEQEGEQRVVKDRADFAEALNTLQSQLNARGNQFIRNFSQERKQGFNDLNTARTILSGKSDIGHEERLDIAAFIRGNATKLESKIGALKNSKLQNLKVSPPPNFNERELPVSFRGQGADAARVDRDPITGKFSPKISGFAIGTNPQIEELYTQLVEEKLADQLFKASKGVNDSASFKQIFSEANLFAQGRDKLDDVSVRLSEFAERKGGALGKLASAGSLITQTGAGLAEVGSGLTTGVAGFGEDVSTKGLVRATTALPVNAVTGTIDLFKNAGEGLFGNSNEIIKLESELENTTDRKKRLEIQREIIERRRGVALTASAIAGTVIGGVELGANVLNKTSLTRVGRANKFAKQFKDIPDVDAAISRRVDAAKLDEVATGSRVSRSLIEERNALVRRRGQIEASQAKAQANLIAQRNRALKNRKKIQDRFEKQQAARPPSADAVKKNTASVEKTVGRTSNAPAVGETRSFIGKTLDRIRALRNKNLDPEVGARSRGDQGRKSRQVDEAEIKAAQTEVKAGAVRNLADELVDPSGRPLRSRPDVDSPSASASKKVDAATKAAADKLNPKKPLSLRGTAGSLVKRTGRGLLGEAAIDAAGTFLGLPPGIISLLRGGVFTAGAFPEIFSVLSRGFGGLKSGFGGAVGRLRGGGGRGFASGVSDLLGEGFTGLGRGIKSLPGRAAAGFSNLNPVTALAGGGIGVDLLSQLLTGSSGPGLFAGAAGAALLRFPLLRRLLGAPFRKKRIGGGPDVSPGGGTGSAARATDDFVQPVDFESFGTFEGSIRGVQRRVVDDPGASLRDFDPFQSQSRFRGFENEPGALNASRNAARDALGLNPARLDIGVNTTIGRTPNLVPLSRTLRPQKTAAVAASERQAAQDAAVTAGRQRFKERFERLNREGGRTVELENLQLIADEIGLPLERIISPEARALGLTPNRVGAGVLDVPTAPPVPTPLDIFRQRAASQPGGGGVVQRVIDDNPLQPIIPDRPRRPAVTNPTIRLTPEELAEVPSAISARNRQGVVRDIIDDNPFDSLESQGGGIVRTTITDVPGGPISLPRSLEVNRALRRLPDIDTATPSIINDTPTLNGEFVPEVADLVNRQASTARTSAEVRSLRNLRDPLAANLSRAESLLSRELGEAAGFFQRDSFRVFRPTDDILIDSLTNPTQRKAIADSLRKSIQSRRNLRDTRFGSREFIEAEGLSFPGRPRGKGRAKSPKDDVSTRVINKGNVEAAVEKAGLVANKAPARSIREPLPGVQVSPSLVDDAFISEALARVDSLGPLKTPSTPRGKVGQVEPEFLGPNRGFISSTKGLSFQESTNLIKDAAESGLLKTDADFQSLLRRRLEPDIPGRKIGEVGDLAEVTGRIENILEAPINSLQGRLGPNVVEKFLDTAADEALATAGDAFRSGLISKEAFARQQKIRGGGNIRQIIDNLKPVVDKFKLGDIELPDIVDLVDPKKKFQTGGKITGPGGPTGDRIPILASNGEFVLNAGAVRKLGLPAVERMNKTGDIPKFQNGGLVTPPGTPLEKALNLLTPAQRQDSRLVSQVARDLNFAFTQRGPNALLQSSLETVNPLVDAAGNPIQVNNLSDADIQSIVKGTVSTFGPVRSTRTPGQALDRNQPQPFNIFDQISGTAGERGNTGVNVGAALRQLSQGQNVFVNERTGEEVIASPILEGELEAKGFTRKIDPDLELLEAIGQGKVLYRHRSTGETLAASELLDSELRAKGFSRDERPLSEVLEKDVFIEKDGSLTLRSRPVGPELFGTNKTPLEKAVEALPPEQRDDPAIRRTLRDDINFKPRGRIAQLQAELDSFDEDFASGGFVRGPGSSRSDSIPIRVSNGEFIINSSAASKLGLPALEALNRGKLPRFHEGGPVGHVHDNGSPNSVEVSIDTAAIADAITSAITTALDTSSLVVDATDAATIIGSAIDSAFTTLTLPAVQVEADTLTVSLDVPAGGIPLDTSALSSLSLGDSVGSAVRAEFERVDGTIAALREDTEALESTVNSTDLTVISALETNLEAAVTTTDALSTEVNTLKNTISNQEQRILDQVTTRLNEEFSTNNIEANVTARMDREVSGIRQNLLQLEGQVKSALSAANQAMSKAVART